MTGGKQQTAAPAATAGANANGNAQTPQEGGSTQWIQAEDNISPGSSPEKTESSPEKSPEKRAENAQKGSKLNWNFKVLL
jgi:hypothetical protein